MFGLVNNTALQLGLGANDKTSEFGASAWLTPLSTNYAGHIGGYWDLNMSLNPVPIPAAIWLFASGILGLAGIKRMKAGAR